MIAADEEAASARIPQPEGKHAAQMIYEAVAVLDIQRDDDFTVAVGQEAVAARLQIRPQLLVVVDLAVAHQPDGFVGIDQGLAAALQVDDRETAVPEDGVAVVLDALA